MEWNFAEKARKGVSVPEKEKTDTERATVWNFAERARDPQLTEHTPRPAMPEPPPAPPPRLYTPVLDATRREPAPPMFPTRPEPGPPLAESIRMPEQGKTAEEIIGQILPPVPVDMVTGAAPVAGSDLITKQPLVRSTSPVDMVTGAAATPEKLAQPRLGGMDPEFEKNLNELTRGFGAMGKGIVRGLTVDIPVRATPEAPERLRDVPAYAAGKVLGWAYNPNEDLSTSDKANQFVGEVLGHMPFYLMGGQLIGAAVRSFGPAAKLGLSARAIQQEAARQAIPTAQSAMGRVLQRGLQSAGQLAPRLGTIASARQAADEAVIGQEGSAQRIGQAATGGMVAGAILGFAFGSIAQAYPEAKFKIQTMRAGRRVALPKDTPTEFTHNEVQREIEKMLKEGWKHGPKPGTFIHPQTDRVATFNVTYRGKEIRLTELLRRFEGRVPTGTQVTTTVPTPTATPAPATGRTPTAAPPTPPRAPTPTPTPATTPVPAMPPVPTAPAAETPAQMALRHGLSIPEITDIGRLAPEAQTAYYAMRDTGQGHTEALTAVTPAPEPPPQLDAETLMRDILTRGGIKPPAQRAKRDLIPEMLQSKDGLALADMAGQLGITEQQLLDSLADPVAPEITDADVPFDDAPMPAMATTSPVERDITPAPTDTITEGVTAATEAPAVTVPDTAPVETVPAVTPQAEASGVARVTEVPGFPGIGAVDTDLAEPLQKVNQHFKTIQSHSGTRRDHPARQEDQTGSGYISFLKSPNPENMPDIIKKAADKAGLVYKEGDTFLTPSVTVRIPSTKESADSGIYLDAATRIASEMAIERMGLPKGTEIVGRPDFMAFTELRHSLRDEAAEKLGGWLKLSDEEIVKRWDTFASEVAALVQPPAEAPDLKSTPKAADTPVATAGERKIWDSATTGNPITIPVWHSEGGGSVSQLMPNAKATINRGTLLGEGWYGARDKDIAEIYGSPTKREVSLRNPYVIKTDNSRDLLSITNKQLEEIRQAGHDGIIVTQEARGVGTADRTHQQVVVFPKETKAADTPVEQPKAEVKGVTPAKAEKPVKKPQKQPAKAEKPKAEKKPAPAKKEPAKPEFIQGYPKGTVDETAKFLRNLDVQLEADAPPLARQILEFGGIAPSRTGAWKGEYNESVPLYLKSKAGMPLDEVASEFGMDVSGLLEKMRSLGKFRLSPPYQYEQKAVDYLESYFPEAKTGVDPFEIKPQKALPQSLKNLGYRNVEEAQMAFQAKDLGFSQWAHTWDEDRAVIAKYTGQTEPRKAYDKLTAPLKGLPAKEIKQRRMDLQMFAKKTGAESDPERDKARRKFFAVANKLDMDREQRVSLARVISQRPVESTKDLTLAEMKELTDFLVRHQAQIQKDLRNSADGMTKKMAEGFDKKQEQDYLNEVGRMETAAERQQRKINEALKRGERPVIDREAAEEMYKLYGAKADRLRRDAVDSLIATINSDNVFAFTGKRLDQLSVKDIELLTTDAGVFDYFRPNINPDELTHDLLTRQKVSRGLLNQYLAPIEEALKGFNHDDMVKVSRMLEGFIPMEGKHGKAAKVLREKFFDPLFKEMVKHGRIDPKQYLEDYYSHIAEITQRIAPTGLNTPREWMTMQRSGDSADYNLNVYDVARHYLNAVAKNIAFGPVLEKWYPLKTIRGLERQLGDKKTKDRAIQQIKQFAVESTGIKLTDAEIESQKGAYLAFKRKLKELSSIEKIGDSTPVRKQLIEGLLADAMGKPVGTVETAFNNTYNKIMEQVSDVPGVGKLIKGKYNPRALAEAVRFFTNLHVQTSLVGPLQAARNHTQKMLTVAHLFKLSDPLRGFRFIANAERKLLTREGQEHVKKYCTLLKDRTFQEGLENISAFRSKATKVLDATGKINMFVFSGADINNVKATFLAAEDAAIEDGLGVKEVLEYANEAPLKTQYGYDIRRAHVYRGSLGKIAGLYTSWTANFVELNYDWLKGGSNPELGKDGRRTTKSKLEGVAKVAFAQMLMLSSEYLFRLLGFAIKVGGLSVLGGHLLSRMFSKDPWQKKLPIVDYVMRAHNNVIKRLLTFDPDEWLIAMEEALYLSPIPPGGGNWRRLVTTAKAFFNNLHVKDHKGNVRYTFSGPHEAVRAALGRTIEAEDRWHLRSAYANLIRREYDPGFKHTSSFLLDAIEAQGLRPEDVLKTRAATKRVLDKRAEEAGLDPKEMLGIAAGIVRGDFSEKMYSAFLAKDSKEFTEALEMIEKLGGKRAHYRTRYYDALEVATRDNDETLKRRALSALRALGADDATIRSTIERRLR